jgi:protein SCO1/2
MESPTKKFPWIVAVGLLLLCLSVALAFLVAGLRSRAAQTQALPVLSTGPITDFQLTNQNGNAVSMADLRGHVWLADIIFTTCPGPCLRMTRQMKEVDSELPSNSQARLVSLTTNPDTDTPAVLKRYAQQYDANLNRWTFLTGTKKEIKELAMDGLKLALQDKPAAERESENDLFIHSTLFVAVDKQGRLRGVFETSGEDVDWPSTRKKILAAIQQLEQEK